MKELGEIRESRSSNLMLTPVLVFLPSLMQWSVICTKSMCLSVLNSQIQVPVEPTHSLISESLQSFREDRWLKTVNKTKTLQKAKLVIESRG